MDIQTYLQRINYKGSVSPTATTLHDLHLAHVQSVPYENLDLHLGFPVDLKLDAIFKKIAIRKRGGICLELNYLFSWLLQELGFEVTLLPASEYNHKGKLSPEEHMVLQVKCPADPSSPSTPYLADVGYGDTFSEPLRFDKLGNEQFDGLRVHRIDYTDSYYFLWRQEYYSGNWRKYLRISMRPTKLSELEPGCRYHETSSESWFKHNRICSLCTPTGRISLINTFFYDVDIRNYQFRKLKPHEYRSVLKKQFGIDLSYLSIELLNEFFDYKKISLS